MVQKAKKNEAMEKIIRVFGEYIGADPCIELVRSEKLGYILMQIHMGTSEIMESRVIEDAENLCRLLICEVAQNVLEQMGNGHDTYHAEPLEYAEIEKHLKPYMDQLPEYGYLCEELCQY